MPSGPASLPLTLPIDLERKKKPRFFGGGLYYEIALKVRGEGLRPRAPGDPRLVSAAIRERNIKCGM